MIPCHREPSIIVLMSMLPLGGDNYVCVTVQLKTVTITIQTYIYIFFYKSITQFIKGKPNMLYTQYYCNRSLYIAIIFIALFCHGTSLKNDGTQSFSMMFREKKNATNIINMLYINGILITQ